MTTRPPCPTRTYTLFPYTTLFRSQAEQMRNVFRTLGAAVAIAVGLAAAGAAAADHEVRMRNKGAEGMMVFEPALIEIEPGDTVTFVATDKSHNAEPIQG